MHATILKFLKHSFGPIHFLHRGLTVEEKKLATPAEFAPLAEALQAKHNIAVLDMTNGKLHLAPCPDPTEPEPALMRWMEKHGIKSSDCAWAVLA